MAGAGAKYVFVGWESAAREIKEARSGQGWWGTMGREGLCGVYVGGMCEGMCGVYVCDICEGVRRWWA